jgi:hypothetical protein
MHPLLAPSVAGFGGADNAAGTSIWVRLAVPSQLASVMRWTADQEHWTKDTVMTAVADLKRRHRAVWAAGDYSAVAEMIDDVPPRDLRTRVAVTPGHDVLDVATGMRNIALRAAAAGAHTCRLARLRLARLRLAAAAVR